MDNNKVCEDVVLYALLNGRIKDDCAPVIVDSSSGAIASFPDGAEDRKVKSLLVNIEPVQDLHGQDAPYPAGGGKNKLDPAQASLLNSSAAGFTITWDSTNTGIISISGTYTGSTTSTSFRILEVPSSARSLNVKCFESTGHCSMRWQSGEDRIVIDINNLTTDTSYNFTVYPILYDGIAPTSWSPYSNVCPISGWTGLNLTRDGVNVWDEQWEVGGISTSTGGNIDQQRLRSKNHISVTPGAEYYLYNGPVGNVTFYWYDNSKTYISSESNGTSSQSFTVPNGAYYLRFVFPNITTYSNNIAINYPSTDHDYHSGTANETIPVSWQDEAGTVYGGNINLTTGVLTVDRAIINPQTTSAGAYQTDGKYIPWITGLNVNTSGFAASNILQRLTSGFMSAVCFRTFSTSIAFNPYGVSYDDQNTAKAAGDQFLSDNNVEFVYTLATPVTYQLDPVTVSTLLGMNNIWADTGDVSVEYCADTKLYLEKLTQPTEDDMIADHAIESGKYFFVGNRLFLSTATIANGATLTPGTNCVETNLAEALNAVNS